MNKRTEALSLLWWLLAIALLWVVDWRIAAGAMLLLWSHNIEWHSE